MAEGQGRYKPAPVTGDVAWQLCEAAQALREYAKELPETRKSVEESVLEQSKSNALLRELIDAVKENTAELRHANAVDGLRGAALEAARATGEMAAEMRKPKG